MNPIVLLGLAGAALLLTRRRPSAPASSPPRTVPVGPPPPIKSPPLDVPPADLPPIVPPADSDPSLALVTDSDAIWSAKGVLFRWWTSQGGTTPPLDPPYGSDPADNAHAWSSRDGSVLEAFLAALGLPADSELRIWSRGELLAWDASHPDDAQPIAAAMYLPIVDGDGGFSQLIARHFPGVPWRRIVDAQPDPQRRTRLLAGFLYGGQRIKIPAEYLPSYDGFRALEDYATAVARDGRVAE